MVCQAPTSVLGKYDEFWADALVYAVYITNHLHHAGIDQVPYNAWTGRKASVAHRRVVGAYVTVRRSGTRPTKLDPHLIMLGFFVFHCFNYGIMVLNPKDHSLDPLNLHCSVNHSPGSNWSRSHLLCHFSNVGVATQLGEGREQHQRTQYAGELTNIWCSAREICGDSIFWLKYLHSTQILYDFEFVYTFVLHVCSFQQFHARYT